MAKRALNDSFSGALTDKTLLNMLQTFTKAPDSVVFMTDAEGRYLYLDGPGLAYLGIDPQAWLGRSIFEFLKDLPEHRQTIRKVLQGQVFFDTSHFGEHYFEDRLFPVIGANDQVLGIAGIQVNVTDKVQAEQKLKANTELLDDLLEILDEGVYLIDTNYTITRANKVCCETYPELAPLLGKKCYETTPYGAVCPDCAAARMFREGKVTTKTFFEKNEEDEAGKWMELTAFPLYEQGDLLGGLGSISGAICIVRDVTPRVELETQLDRYKRQIEAMAEKQMEELRLSEAKLRLILETCGAAISFADHLGRYTYVNEKFKEMLGYTSEELREKRVNFIVSSQSGLRSESFDLIEKTLRDEIGGFRATFELETKSGKTLWGDISVSKIRGTRAEDSQLISVILDVTAQQQLVEQLNRAKTAAEDASLAKSQFLATMSHEIRTPLNGVIGISNLLLGTPLKPKQLEYAKLIGISGESLLTLINDILDFSKIEAGKFELNESEFIVHELLESSARILTSRALEKSLELIVTFDVRVPGPLIGDEGRLRQILLNLAGNAIKFTETGGIHIHLDLEEILQKEIVLRFSITDTGIGIPKDRQDRLFRQFVQVDSSSSRNYGGTGLGLAISKRLVELMNGTISVESEAGHGSTFSFTVRLKCAALVLKCMNAEKYPCITEKRDYCRGIPPHRCARSGRDVAYLQRVYELRGTRTIVLGTSRIAVPALCEQLKIWDIHVDHVSKSNEILPLLHQAEELGRPYRLLIADFSPADPGVETVIHEIQGEKRLEETLVIGLTPLSEDWNQHAWKKPENIRFITKPICCSVLLDGMIRLFFKHESRYIRPGAETQSAGEIGRETEERRQRVLVAEDNRINQIVVSEILKNAGMEAVLTANGVEAVEITSREQFDLVLMDCQMPLMDGYAATMQIRKREAESGAAHLPIIALTANATSGDEDKCLAAGMDAYCSKPINAEELLEKIKKWAPNPAP